MKKILYLSVTLMGLTSASFAQPEYKDYAELFRIIHKEEPNAENCALALNVYEKLAKLWKKTREEALGHIVAGLGARVGVCHSLGLLD